MNLNGWQKIMNMTLIEHVLNWEDFIATYHNNWDEIADCGRLKPSFINTYADKLDIDRVARHQTLKISTIDRYFDCITDYLDDDDNESQVYTLKIGDKSEQGPFTIKISK